MRSPADYLSRTTPLGFSAEFESREVATDYYRYPLCILLLY
jgi:hypothetical protein